jgi:hypothetical protein
MKKLSPIILLLTMTAVSTLAQMKSANLDPDAWYSIIAVHSGKALEIAGGDEGKASGLQLQQNDPTGAANQLFQFKQAKSGFFTITVRHSGKVLEIRDGSLKDHAVIQQADATGQDQQLFTLVKETTGNYRIIARLTGYGFDVLGGVKSLGNNIPVVVYPATGATNQTFQLIEVLEKNVQSPASN